MRDPSGARAEARAALAALDPSGQLSKPLDAEALLVPLARLGDGIRLSIEAAPPLRRWMRALPSETLERAADVLAAEVDGWTLPTAPRHLDAPAVAASVRRRDEAASVATVLRREELARRADLPALARLEARLEAWDAQASRILSREDVGALLGDRAAIEPGWAETFHAQAETPVPSPLASLAPDEAAWVRSGACAPPDSLVERYVSRGLHRARVEGYARGDEPFADELAESIDAVREAGRPVSLVAYAWRRRRPATEEHAAPAGAVAASQAFALVPSRCFARAAAATGEAASESATIDLGHLSPLAAEARAVVEAGRLTVHVYAEASGDVVRVELDGASTSTPDADDPLRFTLSIPWSNEAVTLRVKGARDGSFEAPIELAPDDEP